MWRGVETHGEILKLLRLHKRLNHVLPLLHIANHVDPRQGRFYWASWLQPPMRAAKSTVLLARIVNRDEGGVGWLPWVNSPVRTGDTLEMGSADYNYIQSLYTKICQLLQCRSFMFNATHYLSHQPRLIVGVHLSIPRIIITGNYHQFQVWLSHHRF